MKLMQDRSAEAPIAICWTEDIEEQADRIYQQWMSMKVHPLVVDWSPAPAASIDSALNDLLCSLATSVASLWPNWYGECLGPIAARTHLESQLQLYRNIDRIVDSNRGVLKSWLHGAINSVLSGSVPYNPNSPRQLVAKQLLLTLGRTPVHFLICLDHGQRHSVAIAAAVSEWIVTNGLGRVVVVAEQSLADELSLGRYPVITGIESSQAVAELEEDSAFSSDDWSTSIADSSESPVQVSQLLERDVELKADQQNAVDQPLGDEHRADNSEANNLHEPDSLQSGCTKRAALKTFDPDSLPLEDTPDQTQKQTADSFGREAIRYPEEGMPHYASPGEQLLFARLRRDAELNGIFRFNALLRLSVITRYRVDLVWDDGKLIVEIDGYQHSWNPVNFCSDRERDYRLMLHGYRVLRIPHALVVEDLELSLDRIRSMVRYCGEIHSIKKGRK